MTKTVMSSLAVRTLLQGARLLPVYKNRAVFTSYLEKQYSCNPKYISEECKRLYGDKIEIGWLFRYPERFEFLKSQGIKVLGTHTLEGILYALTSRVVVSNTYYKPALPRRKKQFFLYTWHGGGAYKRVGDSADHNFIERFYTHIRESGGSLYLSSGTFFTENVIRKAFRYKGEVMEKGMPRNDILISGMSHEQNNAIRKKIGLAPDEKLLLYAPTYRKDTQVHNFELDYAAVCEALGRRFGGKYVCGYRSHHVTMFKSQKGMDAGALNLTGYPDMQELLAVCDVLLTDYSSSIWDAALGGIKAFLFCPDLKDFEIPTAFYTDIHSWPFPLAESQEELLSNIEHLDEDKYRSDCAKHISDLGCCETGRASYLVARRIGFETGLEDKIYDD